MKTRRRSTNRLATLLTSSFLLLALAGCKRNQGGPAVASSNQNLTSSQSTSGVPGIRKTWGLHVMNRPGTVFHVEYSNDTVIVDLHTVAHALRGYSEDHRIFLFQDSPELRQKLAPGKNVLLEGLDLRKVDALAVDGQNLVVGTELATLHEALKNAQVQWKAPLNFKDLSDQLAAAREPLPPHLSRFALLNSVSDWLEAHEPKVYASAAGELEGETEIEDSDFATWKVKYHHIFKPDHSLDIDLQLHREAAGLNAEIEAKGNLSEFTPTASILMADGQFKAASYKNTGLHGYTNFNWAISTSEAKTSMNEVRLKLPGKISIPLDFTGLPMSMQISEALLFHPAFTTKGEVAKGGFRVNYSGDEGFKLAGQDVEPDGEAQGDSAIDTTVTFSPLAAFGLVVAVAAPRVELRMGTEEIFEAAGIPETVADKLGDLLQKSSIAGSWLPKKGNPLSTEAAAYFQVVVSTTAADSGMLSLVHCQQFTMVARGQVGADSKILGIPMNTPTKDIFSKDLTRIDPNAKICGAKN